MGDITRAKFEEAMHANSELLERVAHLQKMLARLRMIDSTPGRGTLHCMGYSVYSIDESILPEELNWDKITSLDELNAKLKLYEDTLGSRYERIKLTGQKYREVVWGEG